MNLTRTWTDYELRGSRLSGVGGTHLADRWTAILSDGVSNTPYSNYSTVVLLSCRGSTSHLFGSSTLLRSECQSYHPRGQSPVLQKDTKTRVLCMYLYEYRNNNVSIENNS